MSKARNERRKITLKLRSRYKFITKLDLKSEIVKLLTGISTLPQDQKNKLIEYIKLRMMSDPKFKDLMKDISTFIKSKCNESSNNS